jgi:nitrite reductase/ring-hydroxylating ferredoxin subunit
MHAWRIMNADHAPKTPAHARPCRGKCNPDRSAFLRTTALAAFASVLGACAPLPASAQVGAVSPSRTQGDTLYYSFPAQDGVLIDEANDVVITRVQHSVSAFSLACPHRSSVTLRWEAAEGKFLCPKHDGEFRQNGELVGGKPDRSMDRYAIRREGANLAVDTRTIYQEDLDTQWAKAIINA